MLRRGQLAAAAVAGAVAVAVVVVVVVAYCPWVCDVFLFGASMLAWVTANCYIM
jgi:hypothetical protein